MPLTVKISRADYTALLADRARLDWLADPANHLGNVHLPAGAVEANLHSLRAAIDATMSGTYEKNAPLIDPGYLAQKQKNANVEAREQ